MLAIAPQFVMSQTIQPICSDTATYPSVDYRSPVKVLIGTYPQSAPPDKIQWWKTLTDCPIETYEDAYCVRRYTVGNFWEPSKAQALEQYLIKQGISDAEVFVFVEGHTRIQGWGNYIDYGTRIE